MARVISRLRLEITRTSFTISLIVALLFTSPLRAVTNLGMLSEQVEAAVKTKNYDHAIEVLNGVIKADPGDAQIYNARGSIYGMKGDELKAIADFDEAIRLSPKSAEFYQNRGYANFLMGAYPQAYADLDAAVLLDPRNVRAHNQFAWLLATCPEDGVRNGKKALEEATKACDLSDWKDPACLDTLASAYAEIGDFDSAVRWETRCLHIPSLSTDSKALSREMNRLDLYKNQKPYHSVSQSGTASLNTEN